MKKEKKLKNSSEKTREIFKKKRCDAITKKNLTKKENLGRKVENSVPTYCMYRKQI